MKAALQAGKGGKGKAKGRRPRGGDDWELDGGLEFLQGREELPVLVTLNLVSSAFRWVLRALMPGAGLSSVLHRCHAAGRAGMCGSLTPVLQRVGQGVRDAVGGDGGRGFGEVQTVA